MKRKKICEIPDEFTAAANKDVTNTKFQFELITPMFGGDAESWLLDMKNPVRGQSVKGQLRFWWRTMQNEQDAKALLTKENALWGGETQDGNGKDTRIKSKVSISISNYNIDQNNIEWAEMANNYAVKNDIIPTNVLFPITQDVRTDNKRICFIKEMEFTLNISYPKPHETDVLNTLKLWTLFGGVGARTRRGTGSIYCEDLLQDFQSEKDIHTFVQSLTVGQSSQQFLYPRISGLKIYVNQKGKSSPSGAWRSFLKKYGDFRQDRPKLGNKFGRSYWPEPDAIRRITGVNAGNHTPEHLDGKWFPRAAFGLPILTRFNTPGDPRNGSDIVLKPYIGTGDRLPSPVILKVIKLPDESILQCAIILNQKFPYELTLNLGSKSYPVSEDMLPFHTGYEKTKTMRKGHELGKLNGETIYENLAKHLSLEEVK